MTSARAGVATITRLDLRSVRLSIQRVAAASTRVEREGLGPGTTAASKNVVHTRSRSDWSHRQRASGTPRNLRFCIHARGPKACGT